MSLRFADFRLDQEAYVLYRNGDPVAVEPKVFDLIALLAGEPGRLFSRDELIEAVWRGRVVSDATIAGAVKGARKALGDDGQRQQFIRTVHGRGFRFVADVDGPVVEHEAAAATDDDYCLLVMPLTQHGEAPWSLAILPAEIERVLTRIPLLKISSESARYRDAGTLPAPRRIYEECGAHFLVGGTVQVAEGGIGVTLQLVDARVGFMLWSERFEFNGDAERIRLHDVAIDLCAKLQPQINLAIRDDIERAGAGQSARSLFLQAMTTINLKGCHEASFLDAAELLRNSMALDQRLAHAPAYLALVLAFGYRIGLLSNRDAARTEAIAMAERALQLDDMDTSVLGYCGCALADVGLVERGLVLLRKAVSINDSNPQAWVAIGATALLTGDFDSALGNLQRGIRVSPQDGYLAVWRSLLAIAWLVNRDPQKAADEAQLACEHNDQTYLPWLVLAAARVLLADAPGAERALAEAYRIRPQLSEPEIRGLLGPGLAARLPERR